MVPARNGREGEVMPLAVVEGLRPGDVRSFDLGDGRMWTAQAYPTFSVPLDVLMWLGQVDAGGVLAAGASELAQLAKARAGITVDVLLSADEYPSNDAGPEDARPDSN